MLVCRPGCRSASHISYISLDVAIVTTSRSRDPALDTKLKQHWSLSISAYLLAG